MSDQLSPLTPGSFRVMSQYPALGQMIAAMGSPPDWGAVATSKLCWDNANGMLGIRTTAPNGVLHIAKDSTYNSEGTAAIKITDTTLTSVGMEIGVTPGSNIGTIQCFDPGTAWATKALCLQPTGGNVGIGTAEPSNKLVIIGDGTSTSTFSLVCRDSALNNTMYIRDDGYGWLKAAAWAYSDKKDKENISDLTPGATERIKQLKPIKFDFKGDGPKNNLGFLAEEVQQVIPEAVAVNPLGQPGELMLCTSFIIPHLTQCLQEVIDRLEKLEKPK